MRFQIKKRQSAMQTLREAIRKTEIDLDTDDEELSEEEIAEAEKEQCEEFEKVSCSLRLARKYLFRRSEEEAVYVYTYNTVIEAKMMLRNELNSSHKFRKTNYMKQVSSFSNLKKRYKEASLRSIEFKLRQIVVQAVQSHEFSNTTELTDLDIIDSYSASAFINLMFTSNLLDHISRIDYVEYVSIVISENKKLL